MTPYGLVLVDSRSPWFFPGRAIPAARFVAVDTSSLKVDPDSARVT